jgi:hypothetical protein
VSQKGRPTFPAQRWLRVAPLVLGAACGGPQALGDSGTICFRDDDCRPGLICVAPSEDDLNRVCSSDPTPLISSVEGPQVEMPVGGEAGMAGAMVVAGGGMGAVAGGGAAGSAGSAPAGGGGSGGSAGGGGSGGGDVGGSGGTNAAGTSGSAGTAGGGGTSPEGGAPN